MDAELTKSFAFSASYSSGARALGYNYTLWVTVDALDEARERELETLVERELISRLHTRDLTDQDDFLKGVEKTDAALLGAFWTRLAGPLRPYRPRRLALQRNARTVTTLTVAP
jgi:hypothetical protein